jgi:beta-N-acetylhexosaminidase
MNFQYKLASIILGISMILSPVNGQTEQTRLDVAEILDEMTSEEKVGQLFLIAAPIDKMSSDGYIYDLVENYHIGGILLQPPETSDTNYSSEELQELIGNIQNFKLSLTEESTIYIPDEDRMTTPEYVPLFVAASMDDGNTPLIQIMNEASYIPSQMAIGATWNTEYAYSVGESIGTQLSWLGVNMVFGPTLDVIDDPANSSENGIGTNSFGGDPYWVGVLGEQYIQGLHDGSDQQLAVISRHFPGLGSSDRPMEDEVATIRKSLEQLKQIELAPFMAVSDGIPGEEAGVTDGLLTAHIRYQGFQGNIRATTKPVSLDSSAFSQLMQLDTFSSWRQGGGIVISDSLGYDSIKRFIESTGKAYTGYLVARNAFLAGNDMMLLSDINTDVERTEYEAIAEVLNFFLQKYREDEVFAQQVDQSVLRILTLKARLYGNDFSTVETIADSTSEDVIASLEDTGVRVARNSVTLISPSDIIELEERTGGAPQYGDQVVIFTDTRSAVPCLSCTSTASIQSNAFEEAINRLYGPTGAGLVAGWQFTSFTMEDLAAYLGQTIPPNLSQQVESSETIDNTLREADWIIFVIQDQSEDYYGSTALMTFLDQRSDLIRENLVVVFSTGVPFGLDPTDFSKVDVFFALYSTSEPFIEAAARVLFTEMTPAGASPVSIPGVGYDLIEATSPDPEQEILLEASISGNMLGENANIETKIGDLLELNAGPIVDSNGNIVPDKTPVEFILNYQGESSAQVQVSSTTSGGFAQAAITIDRGGVLSIRAESSGAIQSQVINLNIPIPEGFPEMTVVPEPTITPDITPTSEESQNDEGEEENGDGINNTQSGFLDGLSRLFMGMTGLIIGIAFTLAAARLTKISKEGTIRYTLSAICAGLVFYIYLVLDLPGSMIMIGGMGETAKLLWSALGASLIIPVMLYKERSFESDE